MRTSGWPVPMVVVRRISPGATWMSRTTGTGGAESWTNAGAATMASAKTSNGGSWSSGKLAETGRAKIREDWRSYRKEGSGTRISEWFPRAPSATRDKRAADRVRECAKDLTASRLGRFTGGAGLSGNLQDIPAPPTGEVPSNPCPSGSRGRHRARRACTSQRRPERKPGAASPAVARRH